MDRLGFCAPGPAAVGPEEMKAGGGGKQTDWPEAKFPLIRNLSPAPPFRTSEWPGRAWAAWAGAGSTFRPGERTFLSPLGARKEGCIIGEREDFSS